MTRWVTCRADPISETTDEMDVYIEKQLDQKKKPEEPSGGSGGEPDGPTPQLAIKETRL